MSAGCFGDVTPCKLLWLKYMPKGNVCKLLGSVTPRKRWSKQSRKVNVCRLLGSVTPSELWSNSQPNANVRKLHGSVTPCSSGEGPGRG
jgi:hypothetical protein